MKVRMLIACVALGSLIVAGAPARASTGPVLMMSNFRFCIERPFPCDPADIGYVPDQSGAPLVEQYSSITTANARVGETVTWVYVDDACSAIASCPGHDVRFTRGSPFVPETFHGDVVRRGAGQKTTGVVAPDATPGIYPYRCSIHSSFAMNGAIRIVAS